MAVASPLKDGILRIAGCTALVVLLAGSCSATAFADDLAAPLVFPIPPANQTAAIVVVPGVAAVPDVSEPAGISTEIPASGSGTEELSLSPYGNGPGGDCPHHRKKLVLVPTS